MGIIGDFGVRFVAACEVWASPWLEWHDISPLNFIMKSVKSNVTT
jgi:hypothetical protein